MSEENPGPIGPIRFSGTFVTDADYARRFTRAALSANLFSRSRLVLRLIAVGLILIFGIVAATSSSNGWQALLVAGIAIVLLAIPFVLAFPITTRIMRRHLPIGSTYSIELRDSTMTLGSPEVTTTVAYSYYQSVERRNSFVVLRQRITRRYVPLPAELFTDESYEFLAAHIQPQKTAKPDE